MFYELNDELIVFWNLGQTSETKSRINREKMDEKNNLQSPSKSGSFRKGVISSGISQRCRKKGSMRKLPRLTKVFEFEKSFLVPQSVQVNIHKIWLISYDCRMIYSISGIPDVFKKATRDFENELIRKRQSPRIINGPFDKKKTSTGFRHD